MRETFNVARDARTILVNSRSFLKHCKMAGFGPFPKGERELAHWMADNFAIISQAQLSHSKANTVIALTGRQIQAERPARYGRACLIDLRDHYPFKQRADAPGLEVDAKGVGVAPGKEAICDPHANGLMSVTEAIVETIWCRILDRILEYAKSPIRCSSIYGVIELDFDVINARGEKEPAAILVREATNRASGSDLPIFGSELHKHALAIELLLRRFGVTSSPDKCINVLRHCPGFTILGDCPGRLGEVAIPSSAYSDLPDRLQFRELDTLNIQFGHSKLDKALKLVDFGQYRIQSRFDRPIMASVSDRPGGFGGILWPDMPEYPQPSPAVAISDSLCGEGKLAAMASAMYAEHHIADNFLNRRINRFVECQTRAWSRSADLQPNRCAV